MDADGLGLSLAITHIALGASSYNPLSTRTALGDIREVALIASGGELDNQVTLTASFLAADYTGAAYNVGEVGFYAGDPLAGGILFAVSSVAGRSSPPRGGTNVTNYGVTYILVLSGVPAGSVTVLVDPDATLALAALTQHVAATNPHPRYVRKTGDVMTGYLTLSGNAVSALHAVPKQQLEAAIAALDDGNPIGFVGMFYTRLAPRGWLAMNGQLVSRTTYAALWAHAQAQSLVVSEATWAATQWTRFSSGNGSTTFRLPDVRGEGIRAWDDLRGLDAGRALGSPQSGAIQSHLHTLSDNIVTEGVPGAGFGGSTSGTSGTANFTGLAGESETRMRNFAPLLCIKAGPKTLPAGPVSAPTPAPVTPPPPPPPPVPLAPVASFTGTPTYLINSGGAVAFTDTSTNTPTSWAWDFGDGGTSTVRHPTHTYAGGPGAGTLVYFTVTLTATNASGSNTKTRFDYIARDGDFSGGA